MISYSHSQYLLLIACSQRKLSISGLLPALERYDGGHYRLLRKARREGYWTENLEVFILSAKYGLIRSSTPIENYERRMDQKRYKRFEILPSRIRRVRFMWSLDKITFRR